MFVALACLSAAAKYSSYRLYICGRCAIAMPPPVSKVIFFVPVLSLFVMCTELLAHIGFDMPVTLILRARSACVCP